MQLDQKFIILCLSCAKKKKKHFVNHDYRPHEDGGGVTIEFTCVACGTKEKKTLRLDNPSDRKPNLKSLQLNKFKH